ncbi:GlsB/YeaQ/YmgE family stress response membrane protein [Haloferula rosea]|uniref:GlsB/YeaQ/YmgE family stress response membrane protein n=1 Tax=Haloferula rosea TaxID=490093 RepID=A0A934VF24_9BACT|nr:GlsB/YeaQ/YmgE family stress response membrane protein [Haloferula rosea]MBK1826621.1 GlsB/YeaQ/YmgE family stress response membrane protein [Haloferula rosea]
MEHWIAWAILGLAAGAIARAIVPGEERGGWIPTMILGIIGAFVGGWIAERIGFLPPSDPGTWLPGPKSILSATVGAIIVLSIWKWLRR